MGRPSVVAAAEEAAAETSLAEADAEADADLRRVVS